MRCPKCACDMMPISLTQVLVDRCPVCHGIWLDKTELDSVVKKKLVRHVDVGVFDKSEAVGNDRAAFCHRCDQQMMVLTGAGDIQFDWCDACDGMFFDKGELTILQRFDNE